MNEVIIERQNADGVDRYQASALKLGRSWRPVTILTIDPGDGGDGILATMCAMYWADWAPFARESSDGRQMSG